MLCQFTLIEHEKDIHSRNEKLKQRGAQKMFLWYREFQA